MAARTVAELGRQAAMALQAADEQGVVHRDIKPSNLLVDASGWLWVTDFGLALLQQSGAATTTGRWLGTPRYMSPEQVLGERGVVDHRVDVYALGVTLYELLTLRPAFGGEDRVDLPRRIVEEQPRPPRRIDQSIPRDLETIVVKAVSKAPTDRYATAGALADDLSRFLDDRPIRASRPWLVARAARWARRRWKALAAVSMLTGLFAASLGSNARLMENNRRLEVETSRSDRLSREVREQARLAEHNSNGVLLRLAAHVLDEGRPERAREVLGDLRFDADGGAARSFVLRFLWRRIHREFIVPLPQCTGVALSADGKSLITADISRGLELWDTITGERIRAIDSSKRGFWGPTFSQDGSLVAAREDVEDDRAPEGFSIWDTATGRRVARLPMGRGFRHFLRLLAEHHQETR
jgi:eukaryotic-like serine/threonine-protein kinase